ncbi:anhydro-N-acetylmuramic acid kinase [Limnobacter parvus]|uniref:Anhydro-N-acetylmuramic acid kinase n=1 Tax=Limnobacter parvus TaxID=2939690 RepID=A0ABT1XG97_9BURK|nr:anhydro-N-acetylmuramic acid kinase [Limnobacter parvus]MCR2746308.1 anhydro-N-acetylmuramic acid kinase [Limnobacter parvus]
MIALGAMSGTSTDGVDVAAIQVNSKTSAMRFVGATSLEFPPKLRQTLLMLQQLPPQFDSHSDPLSVMLEARHELTLLYAQCARQLLAELGLEASDVQVLGAHGQTLRHRPELGYTYQMLDGALLANSVGIHVANDFRSADVALAGQGAPLVPAFHQAWLNGKGIHDRTAVLNLGGFSNLTVLNGAVQPLTGGDCGPANCLMDMWAQRMFQIPMDIDGEIASMGNPSLDLLNCFWQHPFFSQEWPKSTGRDAFNLQWFDSCLAKTDRNLPAEDVMATLLTLTVKSIQASLPPGVEQVFVCGGGAKNSTLVSQLRFDCAPVDFLPIENLGLPTQAVEAAAFAWLAQQRVVGLPGNCPSVTGARKAAVLGALYLAG